MIGFFGLQSGFSQSGLMRKVYLKNNETFEGELLGTNPNISYTLRNKNGKIVVFNFEEVSKIEKISDPDVNIIDQSLESEPAIVSKENEKSKLEIYGSVDLYYQYHLNEYPYLTSFTEHHNSFTLGMANIIFAKNFGNTGFKADIALGPRAEIANGYPGTTLSAIKQLYIFYAPIKQLTFTAGTFSTFVGYELINPGDNINYSMSYLFSNGPFYHTGLKMDYSFSETFAFMLGVFNDTDEKVDVNKGKHFGTQLAFTKTNFSLFMNYLTGVDDDTPGSKVRGHQVDLTAAADIDNHLGLGLNLSYKKNQHEDSPDTDWYGTAIYVNYKVKNFLIFGLRGEYINDSDAIIFEETAVEIFSFTFSTNFKHHGFTFIPEFRIDHSNKPIFPKKENELTKFSPAFLMALIYSF